LRFGLFYWLRGLVLTRPLRVGYPCDATQGLSFGFNRTFELGCGTRPLASNSRSHPAMPVARKY
jgi:hypothetical protein